MQKVDLKIFVEVCQWDELEKTDQQLVGAAQEACNTSYSPYSNFCVGTAILLEDGTIIKGSNQENAAYPSGLCAERTAIFWAGANYPDKRILAMATVARPVSSTQFVPVSPCGACRQVMLEYELKQASPIRFITQGENNSYYVMPAVVSLLPLKFSKEQLSG